MGALMAVVSLFIVLNALMLMYRSRLSSFMRLRQLGVSSKMLLLCLFIELACYCSLAVPVGVVSGSAITLALTPVLQATFIGLFDSVFITPAPFLKTLIVSAYLVAIAALGIFFIFPAIQLKQALSRQAAKTKSLSTQRRLVCTGLLGGIIMLSLSLASTTVTSLLTVAVVLLSSSGIIMLWLPMLLLLLRHFTPSHRPLLSYTVASTYQLSGKSRLAICAFFIALSANIGMNVMTDSFRQATVNWLEQRLNAPAYLYSQSLPSLEEIPKGYITKPLYRGVTAVNGHKVTLRSYPSVNENALQLPLTTGSDNTPDAFYGGTSAYINQQMAFRLNLDVGDRATADGIFTDDLTFAIIGHPSTFSIAGIYPDYGNPDMQMILSESSLSHPKAFAG